MSQPERTQGFVNASSSAEYRDLAYVWRIDNFVDFRTMAALQQLETGTNNDAIESGEFGDTDSGLWRLKCYPFGDRDRHHDVALYCVSQDSEARKYMTVKTGVLDDKGNKLDLGQSHYTRQCFSAEGKSWGWRTFISLRDKHTVELQKYLFGGSLTIFVKAQVYVGQTQRYTVGEGPVLQNATQRMAADVVSYAMKFQDVTVVLAEPTKDSERIRTSSFLLEASAPNIPNSNITSWREPVVMREGVLRFDKSISSQASKIFIDSLSEDRSKYFDSLPLTDVSAHGDVQELVLELWRLAISTGFQRLATGCLQILGIITKTAESVVITLETVSGMQQWKFAGSCRRILTECFPIMSTEVHQAILEAGAAMGLGTC